MVYIGVIITPAVGTYISALTYAGNGTVIAGDFGNGNIYRSTDYGLDWSTITPIVDSNIQHQLPQTMEL